MKKLLLTLTITLGCFVFAHYSEASEISEITYPLEETEKVFFESIDEAGNLVIIEIEKIPTLTRVAKGTYKISKTLKGKWVISYNVSINTKNQITGASNLNAKALTGSFSATSLTSNSTSATCSFSQKIGTAKSNGKVVASISNKNLVVN